MGPLTITQRDIFGILLAIIGATTVVLSSPSSEGPPPVLTPDALIEAITQRSFVIFSIIYLVAAIFLACLSEGSIGRRVVVVDIGLCALFGRGCDTARCDRRLTLLTGGFTVLATKAISTLLTKEWMKIVTEWITYPILAVSPATLRMDPALIVLCRCLSSQVSFRFGILTER